MVHLHNCESDPFTQLHVCSTAQLCKSLDCANFQVFGLLICARGPVNFRNFDLWGIGFILAYPKSQHPVYVDEEALEGSQTLARRTCAICCVDICSRTPSD